MKIWFKRFWAAVLVFTISFTAVSFAELNIDSVFIKKVFALDLNGSCGKNILYSLNNATGLLTISGSGYMTNYYDFDGEISPFYYNSSIKNVVIENGVKSVGAYVFEGCSKLTSIVFSDSVESIGNCAFKDCTGLINLTIPDTVSKIEGYAFEGCNGLVSMRLPNNLLSIEGGTFCGCEKLENFEIPNNVKNIGSYSFNNCTKLKKITIPNSVMSIETAAFSGCEGLTNVIFGNNVKRICNYAFSDCTGLTDLMLPDSLATIGEYAFKNCKSIKSVEIPNQVTSIADYAFYYCIGLKNLTISEKLMQINHLQFFCCTGISEITVDKNNPVYDSRNGCNGIIETKTNTLIYGCKNTVIPNDIKVIGADAFSRCTGLTNIDIPDSITSIEKHAFKNCEGLTSINIPKSVTSIGEEAFCYCTGLRSIKIPDSVTNIGNDAFFLCDKVTFFCNEDSYAKQYAFEHRIKCSFPPIVSGGNVASSGKIKLSWETVNGADSYKIYRADSKNGTYKLMKTTSSTSYVNTSATAGKTYYYKVKAVAADGMSSNYSSVVTRTCDLKKPVVTASNVSSSGKNKITWDAVEGATSYKIYRATTKNGEYKFMKTTASTSYINTSAVSGTTYYYKVKAICSNSAADSAYSSIITRTCDLARPTNVKLLFNSSGKPVIKWNSVEGATSYRVYRSTSQTGTYKLMKTTNTTSYTNTSISHGTTYYYKVKAICSKSAADSAYSSVVSGYVE